MATAYLVVALTSLAASILTFFSGFGLGTILMPVMAIYFDIKIAIAATALVHFSNNIFKGILLFKNIRRDIFLKFAIPALIGSVAGAWLLMDAKPYVLFSYKMDYKFFHVYLSELLIAVLILIIVAWEWLPETYFRFNEKHVIPGALITGFAGGFTGLQGALRTSFLIKLKLTKEEFVATGTAISLVIDFVRIIIYIIAGSLLFAFNETNIVLIGIAAAITGAYIGKWLLHKTTFTFIKILTTICIVVFAVLLGMGLMHQ